MYEIILDVKSTEIHPVTSRGIFKQMGKSPMKGIFKLRFKSGKWLLGSPPLPLPFIKKNKDDDLLVLVFLTVKVTKLKVSRFS